MDEPLYELVANAGDGCTIPIGQQGLTAEVLASNLASRLRVMEMQGFWISSSGRRVPLTAVTYTIRMLDPDEAVIKD